MNVTPCHHRSLLIAMTLKAYEHVEAVNHVCILMSEN